MRNGYESAQESSGTITAFSAVARAIGGGYLGASVLPPRVQQVLEEVFGHRELRPGQAEIIQHVLAGTPTLAVMPTGAGKSLCYQLPALLFDDLTVVVSPLIALMRDQVGALRARGIEAAAVTSADPEDVRRGITADVAAGRVKILYVAPERFRGGAMLDLLSRRRIALFAVDEAHCISTWGHDFRPDYARLGQVISELAPERIVALTATATPEVRADIVKSLRLSAAAVVVTGFDRPNLELEVVTARGQEKINAARLAVGQWIGIPRGPRRGTAIVYASTRRRSEEVASGMSAAGWRAAAYHAGLAPERRSEVQTAFEKDQLEVVVATTAFGMGVDKADVRVVVHYDLPPTPEAYYQEVGRAGRDGQPAGGILLYDPADLRFLHVRLESSCPRPEAVERALYALGSWAGGNGLIEGGIDALSEALEPEVGPAARSALIALERAGAIAIRPGEIELRDPRAEIDHSMLERRARLERSKLEAMIGYVQRARCRRRYLTDYFGDPHAPERCGACDRCRAPAARELEGPLLTDALKALSCVARMKGRWGKGRVVDVLLGSRSRPVLDSGLEQLSTYGLLAHYSRDRVMTLLDALGRAGLIEVTLEEYPRLRLTALGVDTLKNRRPIVLHLEKEAPRATAAIDPEDEASLDPEDQPLVDALKVWRRDEASKIGKPAYIVAHDRTLEAVAAARPASLDELGEVGGIGPVKLDKWGDAILGVVRANPRAAQKEER